jgi:hypothetical protein
MPHTEHNGRPDFIYVNISLRVPILVPHLNGTYNPVPDLVIQKTRTLFGF